MGKLANLALRREPGIIRTLFFLCPLLTLLVPKITVATVPVLFMCCVGLSLARGVDLKSLFRIDATLALFGLTAVYLFINAAWSLDHERAFTAAFWYVAVVLMSYAGCRALARWPERSLRIAATAFLVGAGIGIAVVLFEAATGRLATLALYKLFPLSQPGSLKGFVVRGGEIVRIAPGELNANIAVMVLALWPALLCVATQLRGTELGGWCRWAGPAALLAAVAAATFLSEHDSSKAALVVSVLVFALATLWPNLTRRALWLGWCLAFALVIPLALAAYKAELHKATWLPFSAQARVTLWAYTAEHVPSAPLLGIGASSTRKLDQAPENREKHWKAKQKTEGFGWRAGAHAHNAFLQTWYELGAAGVILFMAAGASLVMSLRRLPPPTQRYALAQFAAFFAIVAFGWGMWQAWLLALAGLSALYIALAGNFSRAAQEDAPSL